MDEKIRKIGSSREESKTLRIKKSGLVDISKPGDGVGKKIPTLRVHYSVLAPYRILLMLSGFLPRECVTKGRRVPVV